MASVPRLRVGCDIKSLPLTPSEAFLLSCLDTAANKQELSLVTGFTGEQVAAMLDRLTALGALEGAFGRSKPDSRRQGPPSGRSHTRLRAPPEPMQDTSVADARRAALGRKLSGTQSTTAGPATRTPTSPVRPLIGAPTPRVRPTTPMMGAPTPPVRPTTPMTGNPRRPRDRRCR